jgi:hypothetical protein
MVNITYDACKYYLGIYLFKFKYSLYQPVSLLGMIRVSLRHLSTMEAT